MANFPVHHGITLAGNAYIENLHVERLASDPVPVSAGRVWFNTTDKVWRQSTLDGGGAVIVRTFLTEEAFDLAMAAEVTARTLADTTLQANIDAEAGARAAADTTLGNNLAAEVTARQLADITMQAGIDAEATARALEDTSIRNLLTGLTNAFVYQGTVVGGESGSGTDLALLTDKSQGDYYKVATAGYFKIGEGTEFYANVGDGIVWNNAAGVDIIDNTNSTVAGTADYITVTGTADTGYTVDIATAFKNVVSTVQSGLATEITAREQGDITLQANIDTVEGDLAAEVTARGLADTTLQTNINTVAGNLATEVTARTLADTTLQAAIDAEVTARGLADTTLQTQIGTLSSLSTTSQTNLVDAINEVKALTGDGTQGVRDDYNATIWTYASVAPATVHTLAHALATDYVDFSVMIQREDTKWYNDIASIVVDSSVQATLYLSEAADVRVIARSAETI